MVRCAGILLLLGAVALPAQSGVLSFDERVAYHERLERVLDAQRDWPNPGPRPPFEARVHREDLVRSVEGYLLKSAALRPLRPIVADDLQREVERMARSTRDPEVLAELFAALEHNPYLIAECLGRRFLADRSYQELVGDSDPHPGAIDDRWREPWIDHSRLRTVTIGRAFACESPPPERRERHTAIWTGSEMIVWGGQLGSTHYRNGSRFDPVTDTWQSISDVGAPSVRSEHTAVWTGTEMIVWGGSRNSGVRNDGARYDPLTDSWQPLSAGPAARREHTAVWTGSEMIVWGGGTGSGTVRSGGRYDPSTDSWQATSTGAFCPAPRFEHTAVWTGSQMVVWGGIGGATWLQTGGRYDPGTDTWQSVSVTGAPASRSEHTAVWTGGEMVVWGGQNAGSFLGDGARYDPMIDGWTPVSSTGAPNGRWQHAATWTGSEMVVWGGRPYWVQGGLYNPASDSWRPTSTVGAPEPRRRHTAVWTGTDMIVWGGETKLAGEEDTGGIFDPVANTWLPTSDGKSGPPGRDWAAEVWTGVEMIVWGGLGTTWYDTGGRYLPAVDAWLPTSTNGAPSPRYLALSVWTGTEMIVWGGLVLTGGWGTSGGFYDPATDSWRTTSLVGAPASQGAVMVWTGGEAIVWGGFSGGSAVNTGARLDPVLNVWTPTSTTGAPSPRGGVAAAWTGTHMIVAQGVDSTTLFTDGALYEPSSDAWSPIAAAPNGRLTEYVVWTGSEMISWGGNDLAGALTGGGEAYDVAANRWRSLSTTNEPSPRYFGSVVWSGTEMVVWGGGDTTFTYDPKSNQGGRYDPVLDRWLPTSLVGAADARWLHSAVWTGRQMLVWGGWGGAARPVHLRSGGQYEPATDQWVCGTGGCPFIILTPSSLPPGRLGTPYSVSLAAFGGTAPYAFTLTSGSLPPGVSLSGQGVLAGTPTTAGMFGFDVTATDSLGCRGTATYVITVVASTSDDYVVGEGLGQPNTNRVRVYDASGTATAVDFQAYGAGGWGTNVASGPLDGSPESQILTGPGPGPVYGPQVRGFDRAGTPIGSLNYFAYGTLKYGVNVSSGELDADGFHELLSGAGPGAVFGPHVRGWDYDGGPLRPISRINFFAYGTLKWGANVGAGNVDADASDELLTGAGPGSVFAPTVHGYDYDGSSLATIGRVNFDAYPLTFGVAVAGGDVDADSYGDIATAPGPGPSISAWFKGFELDGGALGLIPGFDVTPLSTLYGGRVGLGDIEADGALDLLAGAGRDPGADATVLAFGYAAGSFSSIPGTPFLPFGGLYGVNVTAGALGY